MSNISKIHILFQNRSLNEVTNSEISKITGIKPHQQVFQITQKLVSRGVLRFVLRGKEKVFFLAADHDNRENPAIKNIQSEFRKNQKFPESSARILENFQRVGSESNSQVGKDFEVDAQKYFYKNELILHENHNVVIGVEDQKRLMLLTWEQTIRKSLLNANLINGQPETMCQVRS